MMKKFLLISAACMLLTEMVATAQTTGLTGAQILRSARSIYDQGRLHELPVLLEEALKNNRFSNDNEIVEANRLLVLTYIYLEEPQKADESMLAILNTDHFFKPAESDPVEFRNLFKKFRTYPVFSAGVRAGLNGTAIGTIATHYIDSEGPGYGVYNPLIGFNIALSFEKEISPRFVANGELMYTTQKFNYFNDHVYFVDPSSGNRTPATVDHIITHTRVQFNAIGQYKLKEPRENEIEIFIPYVYAGAAAGYLLSSSFEGLKTVENNVEYAGTFDNTDQYKPFNIAAIAGAGIKYKLGSIYVTGDVRVQYGILNVVDGSKRFENTSVNQRLRTEYSYVNNDFSVHNAMFSIGIIYPYFNPKKLIK